MRRSSCISLVVGLLSVATVLSQRDSQCFDQDTGCKIWARNGICKTHSQEMREQCPEACALCGHPPSPASTLPKRTIERPTFDCGRPYTSKVEGTTPNRVARQTSRQQQQGASSSGQDNANINRGAQSEVNVVDTICGATVIHPRFILTAAHCVLDPARPIRSVRLGELDLSSENETNSRPADYAIEAIIVHPDFRPNLVEKYNDVALLKTATPIAFNEFVYPFCLSHSIPPPGAVVTASGFGKVNKTSYPSILQEGDLNIISASECEAAYREKNLEGLLRTWYPNLLQGRDVMCAGHPTRGSCEGDGGGPLFLDNHGGRRFLVGVVSVAMACTGTEDSKLPGIYVRVADHIDFIDSVIYGLNDQFA